MTTPGAPRDVPPPVNVSADAMMRARLFNFVLLVAATAATCAWARAATGEGVGSLAGMKVMQIDGRDGLLVDPAARATAVVVLGTECPIANKSIAKLNFLHRSFGKWDARLLGVISDPTVTRAEAAKWAAERKVAFPVLFDASGELASALRPQRTPHALVLDRAGRVVYSGRIDDANPALGREKHDADSYDLAAAVTDVLHNRPVKVSETPLEGCEFESWERRDGAHGAVTFTRDIAPILFSNCVSCHRAGEVAPFPLTAYEDAAKRARMIARVTGSGFMPPWKPVPEGSAPLHGERRLTPRQIELLAEWAKTGAPRGDDADLPPVPPVESGWRLGEPDLVLEMPEGFTVPAAGRDIYRAFVVPIQLPEDAWVSAVEFKPGAPTVVHHAIFYLDATGAARRKDSADPLPGYLSFGGPGFLPAGGLGGWAPGARPDSLPAGVGRLLPKGTDLVMQVHYHPDGIERKDRSKLAVYFQKPPVTRRVGSIMLVNRDIDIPPGDSNYTRTAQFRLPAQTTLLGVMPHMHLLGREMRVWAELPDGNERPIVRIDDWDFRWQDQYRLAEPMTLPAGTTLRLWARYDNSSDNPENPNRPPARVRRGEQTTDEMCMAFVEFIADDAAQVRTMRRAMIRQRLAERFGQ